VQVDNIGSWEEIAVGDEAEVAYVMLAGQRQAAMVTVWHPEPEETEAAVEEDAGAIEDETPEELEGADAPEE
jgi:hypothetical protein